LLFDCNDNCRYAFSQNYRLSPHDPLGGHIGSDCPRDWRAHGAKDSRTALIIKRTDNATPTELGQRCRAFALFLN